MMKAEHVPFAGFDGLNTKDARDFLKRDTNLSYLEYLVSKNETALPYFQELLSHYVAIIPDEDPVHHLALEKFTRCVCFYVLASSPLSELSQIKATLETYFPFYIGKSYKLAWLTSYAEKNNTHDMIQHMFTRDSIRIRVGQLVAIGVLSNIDLPKIKDAILTMANDPFFSTHQQPVFGAINAVTSTAGWAMRQIPVLSHVQAFVNKVAEATDQSLEISTGRKATLLSYADRVLSIFSDHLHHVDPKRKLAHVELLCIFFASANDYLKKEIADIATKLILSEKTILNYWLTFLKILHLNH